MNASKVTRNKKKNIFKSTNKRQLFVISKISQNQEIPKKPQKLSSKVTGKEYSCFHCLNSYYSYSSLYVHLKYKHRIKRDKLKISYSKLHLYIVKKRQVGISNFLSDERYLSRDNFLNSLIEIFERAKITLEKNQDTFTEYGIALNGLNILKNELFDFINNLKTKTFVFEKNHKIDKLIVYFFYSKILSEYEIDELIEILVFMCLVREFLNLVGPQFVNNLKTNCIENEINSSGKEYTEYSYGFDIPYLIVNFQEFLKSSYFEKNMTFIKLNLLEFTNFLYDEEVIFYKLEEQKFRKLSKR